MRPGIREARGESARASATCVLCSHNCLVSGKVKDMQFRDRPLVYSFLPLLSLFLSCGDGGATSAAASAGPEDDLPAAIVGKAPPPSGTAVHYFEENRAATGTLSIPKSGGPHPAVILIHEWNGLGDRVRQVADALSGEGYIALAVDLFSGKTGSNRSENMALVQEARAHPKRLIENLNAAVRFLRDRDDVTGRIGAMGWCFGGGVALSFALEGENHDATAIFYGRLLDDPEKLKQLSHEIYGTFAANDRGIPVESVHRFAVALRQAGVPNDIHIYDDVDHGFWLWVERDPDLARGPAADAWSRLKTYLKRTLH